VSKTLRLSKEQVDELVNKMVNEDHDNARFAKAAHSLWIRFKNYDKHPPWAILDDNGEIAAVCMITLLQREPYANLYEIFAVKKGYARKLYWKIMSDISSRTERLKMSCTPSSIGWHMKNGIIGWGTDPSGSIRVDIPIMKTLEDQLKLRENWEENINWIIPPEKNRSRLKDEENSFGPRKKPKVEEAIDTVGDFYLRRYL